MFTTQLHKQASLIHLRSHTVRFGSNAQHHNTTDPVWLASRARRRLLATFVQF